MAQKLMAGLIIVGLFLVSGVGAGAQAGSDDRQVFAWTLIEDKGALLVDVRDWRVYQRGSLDHAINIPLTDIVSGSIDLGKDKTRFFVLYGEDGFRVSDVTALMVKKGYTNTFYAGSYEAMRNAEATQVGRWPN